MGATRNTGYLENLIQYDASDNVAIATSVNPSYKVTLGGSLLGTSAVFSSSITAGGNITINANGAQANNRLFTLSNGYMYLDGNTNGLILENNSTSSTRIRLEATDAMRFETASTEQMRIDSNGRVGIGTTPNAWFTGGGYKVIELGLGLSLDSGNDFRARIASNAFVNSVGDWKYRNTSQASIYTQYQGNHIFETASSGTAGNTITFTERMRITSGGNVGIGSSSPDVTGFGYTTLTIKGGTTAGYAGVLELQTTQTTTNGQNVGIIAFLDGTSRNAQIGVQRDSSTSTSNMMFYTNAGSGIVERMRIRSGGEISFIPTTWTYVNPNTTYRNMDIGAAGWLYRDAVDAYLLSNHYYNSSGQNIAKYSYSEGIGAFAIAGGNLTWYSYGASVTAGSHYATTPRFTVTYTGNVGIGTTSPSSYAAGNLAIVGSTTSNFGIAIDNTYTAGASGTSSVFLYNNGSLKVRYDYSRGDDAGIIGTVASIPMWFLTGGVERMRITSGGVTEFKGTDSSIISRMVSSSGMLQFYPYHSAYGGPIIQALNAAQSAYYPLRVECTTMTVSGNQTVTGTKSFAIEHPLDSKKTLLHYSTESPQADLIYRGKINLVDGKAEVNIDLSSKMTDGTFIALCRNVQCFTTNETGWDMVKGKVIGNILTIESDNQNCTDEISWMVIGERYDESIKKSNMLDSDGDLIVEQQAY